MNKIEDILFGDGYYKNMEKISVEEKREKNTASCIITRNYW